MYTAARGALFLGSSAFAFEQNCSASSSENSCFEANLMSLAPVASCVFMFRFARETEIIQHVEVNTV